MGSLYLSGLSVDQRANLEHRLWSSQQGKCFICELPIDLRIHQNAIDVDHVQPTKLGGKDDQSNFALTHSSCNRSKQASDLRVARVLARFTAISDECAHSNRGPNLDDIFQRYDGAKYEFKMYLDGDMISFSFPELGDNGIKNSPLYTDPLSGLNYFFAKLPIAYLFHDDRINPRAIGKSIAGLVEEFFKKRPQLHVSLGWVQLEGKNDQVHVRIFDGQHKAAAQVLLGIKELPVRVFVNPDLDILLTTNTNAGTSLRQVAFDKSVQRHLGSALYIDRVERYQRERNLSENDFTFTERDLVTHFKGEAREMKRYILDAVRDGITHHPDNSLIEYVDFGGRGQEKPLSYSTIDKTFYSFFIYQELLETSLDYRMEEGENPRELEKEQILRLMNIIAEEIYVGKFDPAIGTYRIENRIQKGEQIPEDHLRAYRLSREEIIYNWLRYIQQIVQNHFISLGVPVNDKKLFQYKFPQPLWDLVRVFVRNLKLLPVWVNSQLSLSVFGGKQNYDYWQTIFESGKSPQNQQVLATPLNLMTMIRG
jgi:hypothetical protein